MNVTVTATVQYTCFLNEAKTRKVKAYAEENDCTLEDAVAELYYDGMLDLYDDVTESDFTPKSRDQVEED